MNPFIIRDYISPEFFCDRQKEMQRILSAMNNQRNITLSSIRKMGKTGLIHHVLYQLDQSKEIDTIYLDIYDTNTLSEFINKLGTALLQVKETFSEKLKRRTNEFIQSIRPVISYDNLTGIPSLSFNLVNNQMRENTLNDLFRFLQIRSSEKK